VETNGQFNWAIFIYLYREFFTIHSYFTVIGLLFDFYDRWLVESYLVAYCLFVLYCCTTVVYKYILAPSAGAVCTLNLCASDAFNSCTQISISYYY